MFGNVEYVEGIVEGEMGFVTGVMTEATFDEKASEIQMISRIRLG